jgi:tRNA(adenine34) deaminase
MTAALDVAEQGMAAGELPIAAVVVLDDDVVGAAYTRDRTLGRKLVHADLLAMIAADERLGWHRRPGPLTLAVTLEPCVMCLGAAMVLGISDVYYGLESPADGGSPVAASWQTHPTMPWFSAPTMTAGVLRDRVRDQFRRYISAAAEDSGFTRWAQSVLDLTNDETTPPPTSTTI